MAKQAAVYIRVSPGEEAQPCLSLEAQEKACRRYCEDQGWDDVQVFQEGISTGSGLDRPRLNSLRAAAGTGEIDVIVASDIARFSKGRADFLRLWKELYSAGVEMHTVKFGPLNERKDVFMALIASHEQTMASERTRRAFLDRAREGSVIVGTNPPYGYRSERRDDGLIHLFIDDEEARVVGLIYEWYIEGDGSLKPLGARKIAQKLTELGVRTRAAKRSGQPEEPRAWATSTVLNILSNETYVGVWFYRKTNRTGNRRLPRPKEEQVPVDVPALVSRETWEAAQRQRKRNRRRFRGL